VRWPRGCACRDRRSIDGQTHVGHVDGVPMMACSQQEVFGLDVAVQVVGGMQRLKPMQQLVGQHHGRLQGERLATVAEQIFQVRSQQLKHHDLEAVLPAMPEHPGKPWLRLETLVDADLFVEERRVDLAMLQLHGDRVASLCVASCVRVSIKSVGTIDVVLTQVDFAE